MSIIHYNINMKVETLYAYLYPTRYNTIYMWVKTINILLQCHRVHQFHEEST